MSEERKSIKIVQLGPLDYVKQYEMKCCLTCQFSEGSRDGCLFCTLYVIEIIETRYSKSVRFFMADDLGICRHYRKKERRNWRKRRGKISGMSMRLKTLTIPELERLAAEEAEKMKRIERASKMPRKTEFDPRLHEPLGGK